VPLQALAIGAPGIFSTTVAKWRKLPKGTFAARTEHSIPPVFNL